jgi:hypothetical protein
VERVISVITTEQAKMAVTTTNGAAALAFSNDAFLPGFSGQMISF